MWSIFINKIELCRHLQTSHKIKTKNDEIKLPATNGVWVATKTFFQWPFWIFIHSITFNEIWPSIPFSAKVSSQFASSMQGIYLDYSIVIIINYNIIIHIDGFHAACIVGTHLYRIEEFWIWELKLVLLFRYI